MLLRIGMMVFTISTVGKAREVMEDKEDMKWMITEMNQRLILTEQKLVKTENELASAKNELMTRTNNLEKDVNILKDPPYLSTCGARYPAFGNDTSTVTYWNLLSSSTNTKGGGLDIETGIFTSPHPGIYTVTWSLYADDNSGEDTVSIYLHKNGEMIKESRHDSFNAGGYQGDQGGRTLFLPLELGDTVSLNCHRCNAGIVFTTFCVSLTTPDIVF